MIKKDYKTVLALNGFRVCGNMNEEALLNIISKSRINRLKKEHIIEKVSYQDNHISKSKNQFTYRLTEHGKKVTREFTHKGNFQCGRGNERHNTALSLEYSRLDNQEKNSAMNEQDLKEYLSQKELSLLSENRISEANELLEKMQQMSLIDLTYTQTQTQELCCVEIITKNYSVETINLKEYTAVEIVQADSYKEININ